MRSKNLLKRRIGLKQLSRNSPLSAQGNSAKLVHKLRPRSPIRHWLTQHPEREPGSAATLFHALEYTQFCDGVDHAIAYRILSEMPLSEKERLGVQRRLLDALAQPAMYKDTLQRIRRSLSFDKSVVGWTALVVLVTALSSTTLLALTLLGLITIPALRFWYHGHLARQSAAAALARVGDPTCLVLLSQHMCPSLRSEVLPALKALLPTVTEDWYGNLPLGAVHVIIHLAESENEETALAALDALQRAGDGSAVKEVERLTRQGKTSLVRDHAAAVLPTLIARRELENASSVLLRASAGAATDNLVLPVYGSAPDTTNLLRAAQSESPN